MPKKISDDLGQNAGSKEVLARGYDEQKQMTRARTKIAKQMSGTLRIVYLFNMIASFVITLLMGFDFFGFKLDPVTYITYMVSSITFASITTLITKLLNK